MCTPTNKPPNLHKFGNVVCLTLYIFKVVKILSSSLVICNAVNKYGHKVWNVVLVFWVEYLLHHTTHLSQHSHHQRQKIKVITLGKNFFSASFHFSTLKTSRPHLHTHIRKTRFVPKKNVNWHIYVILLFTEKLFCSIKLINDNSSWNGRKNK